MGQETPFQSFITLIDFDQSVYKKECSVDTKKQEINSLYEKSKSFDDQLADAKVALHDAKKMVDEKELEMKSLEDQEKDKKRRLDMVATQREYQSLKSEIEMIGAQQLALEDVLVAAWNQLELAQKKYVGQEKTHQQRIQEIKKQVDQKKAELNALQVDLDAQKELRDSKKEGIPEEWLEKYLMMRTRVHDPVVSVDEGYCSSCYHPITEQEIIALRRKKLLQCKGCYRFLYQAVSA